MIRVICDSCKQEIKGKNYPEVIVRLEPSIKETAITYRLTMCPKCFNNLQGKMANEEYDRV